MPYPSILSVIANPQPTDRLNSPSHSSIHQAENTAITEIETFVGTLSSIAGSLTYDIRAAASNGGGHVQTANKGGTGQTSFTKGDLLVAQSSSVLTKLAVGTDNQVLIANSSVAAGVNWGATPGINVQSFVSTGVWTKPASAARVFVELWGAGGGGGGSTGNSAVGGGGGGGYITAWFQPSILSASVIVGVGAGGTGGNQTNGTVGGITVFDAVSSLLTAYGGGRGAGSGSGNNNAAGGGAGLTSNGGDATSNTPGSAGDTYGGNGGASPTGSGVGALYVGGAAGGGGGGAGSGNGGATIAGGGGGGGVTSSVMGTGGTSKAGGSGSSGSILTNGSVLAGTAPGGGGGGASGAGSTGGPGGAGKVIVTTFL